MMIYDRLLHTSHLSDNETTVAQYLYHYKGQVTRLTAADIAHATFTSASTVVRLAQKLGYNGWSDLKEALQTEKSFMENCIDEVDANIPFSAMDPAQKISRQLEKLETESIRATADLIRHDELQKATLALANAKRIYIFGMANSASCTYDFQYKMRFLFKPVEIINNRDDFAYLFQTMQAEDCCLFISYSGETFDELQLTEILCTLPCPRISLTSYTNNHLISCTNAHLYIPEYEKRYAKIGHFSSNIAIHYLLDVLFACVFAHHYSDNMDKRKMYIETTDFPHRFDQ